METCVFISPPVNHGNLSAVAPWLLDAERRMITCDWNGVSLPMGSPACLFSSFRSIWFDLSGRFAERRSGGRMTAAGLPPPSSLPPLGLNGYCRVIKPLIWFLLLWLPLLQTPPPPHHQVHMKVLNVKSPRCHRVSHDLADLW